MIASTVPQRADNSASAGAPRHTITPPAHDPEPRPPLRHTGERARAPAQTPCAPAPTPRAPDPPPRAAAVGGALPTRALPEVKAEPGAPRPLQPPASWRLAQATGAQRPLLPVKREQPQPLPLLPPKSVQRTTATPARGAAHVLSTAALNATGGRGARPTPPSPAHLAQLATPAQASAAHRAEAAVPAVAPRVAVPDGRRTPQAEAKRADNERRALELRLTQRDDSFFGAGILEEGAPAHQRDMADALMARAHQAAARAHYVSKDNRLGTALSKFEELAARLPAMHRFIGLRHEGDLDTSEYNERLLVAVAQYVRERPKAGGDLVVAKTVSGQVSAIKKCVEDHLGRPIIAPTGGAVLKRVTRAMAYEDGPAGVRKYLAPLRLEHFARLVDPRSRFDYTSPGWPMMRWALLLTMHHLSPVANTSPKHTRRVSGACGPTCSAAAAPIKATLGPVLDLRMRAAGVEPCSSSAAARRASTAAALAAARAAARAAWAATSAGLLARPRPRPEGRARPRPCARPRPRLAAAPRPVAAFSSVPAFSSVRSTSMARSRPRTLTLTHPVVTSPEATCTPAPAGSAKASRALEVTTSPSAVRSTLSTLMRCGTPSIESLHPFASE